MHSNYLKIILVLVVLQTLSSCLLKSVTDRHGRKSSEEPKFVFDEESRKCMRNGKVGLNEGIIDECGLVANLNLSGKDFSGKDLMGMVFRNVDLSGAKFNGADLFAAQFIDCNMRGVDFSNALAAAIFDHSDLSDANLSGAKFLDLTRGEKPIAARFESSSFKGARIDSATLMQGHLTTVLKEYEMIYVGENSEAKELVLPGGDTIQVGRSGADAVSGAEYARIHADYESLKSIQLREDDGWYEKIFGRSTIDAVFPYISERIKFLISKTNASAKGEMDNAMALNYGIYYWVHLYNMRKLGVQRRPPAVTVNGVSVDFSQPRSGLMSLGPKFTDLSITQVRRQMTVMHEPRHSDCTKLPSNQDIYDVVVLEKVGKPSECNHTHDICKEGHPLAGQPACDAHPWGAYSIALIFMEKVVKDCLNCSEEVIQFARIAAKETRTRITVLDDMLSGKLGNPDMRGLP